MSNFQIDWRNCRRRLIVMALLKVYFSLTTGLLLSSTMLSAQEFSGNISGMQLGVVQLSGDISGMQSEEVERLGDISGMQSGVVQLSGYVSGMQSVVVQWPEGGTLWQTPLHNRLNFGWQMADYLRMDAGVRNRLILGSDVMLNPQSISYDTGWVDLSWNWATVGMGRSASLVGNSSFDRLNLTFEKGKWKVQAGRQRINWGQTFVWNPNDLFNTYSFFDFDYPERPGCDALRTTCYHNATSSSELALSLNHNGKLTAAALHRWNKNGIDYQIIIGEQAQTDLVVGGACTGDFNGLNLRAESAYFHPIRNSVAHSNENVAVHSNRNAADTKGIVALSVGADYIFSNSLMLQVEVLYNNVGGAGGEMMYNNVGRTRGEVMYNNVRCAGGEVMGTRGDAMSAGGKMMMGTRSEVMGAGGEMMYNNIGGAGSEVMGTRGEVMGAGGEVMYNNVGRSRGEVMGAGGEVIGTRGEVMGAGGGLMDLYAAPLSAKRLSICNWNLFANASFPLTPRLSGSVSSMYFVNIQSIYAGFTIDCSLATNLDFSVVAQYFTSFKQSAEISGKPPTDTSGKPSIDTSGKPSAEISGKPSTDTSGKMHVLLSFARLKYSF